MSVDDDDAVLFSAATLFDGFIDGVMNFEAGGTVVEIECNTVSGTRPVSVRVLGFVGVMKVHRSEMLEL